jgi:hypothetical protein
MYPRLGAHREGETARIAGVEYFCGHECGVFSPSGYPEIEREAT